MGAASLASLVLYSRVGVALSTLGKRVGSMTYPGSLPSPRACHNCSFRERCHTCLADSVGESPGLHTRACAFGKPR